MNIDELAFLLWASQGIMRTNKAGMTFRTVPCSGASHSFETYLFIINVEDLHRGIYRYLPMGHKLLFIWQQWVRRYSQITSVPYKTDIYKAYWR